MFEVPPAVLVRLVYDHGMSEHPHRAEAIKLVRERYNIEPEVPDALVANTFAVASTELALAARDVRAAVIASLPRPLRRLFGN